ncbi:Nup192 protein [Martiniozyma asiatica (nom. inval.)]|nr:Nup192 protein [Martiniozyma asiatica]
MSMQALYLAIQSGQSYQQLLVDCQKELDTLLTYPKRTDALGEKIIVDGVEYQVNDEFRSEVSKLAKMVDMDEKLMAGYVMKYGTDGALKELGCMVRIAAWKGGNLLPSMGKSLEWDAILGAAMILKETDFSNVKNLDQLAGHPIQAFIILAFLSNFIPWCKLNQSRIKIFEFVKSVEEPMRTLISVGSLEAFLTICADSSILETTGIDRPLYDFRAFLQIHIPKLLPKKTLQLDEEAMGRLNSNEPVYKPTMREKHLPLDFLSILFENLNAFVESFVSNAAFMLTILRDQEEDALLSTDKIDAENADLERLYLGMFYLYSGRTSEQFWDGPLYGFLQWGSKCNSPLIMAAYTQFLSALNGKQVFTFLQSTNEEGVGVCVSWSSLFTSLAYYNEQLKKTQGAVIELGEDSVIYLSAMFDVFTTVAPFNKQELLESDGGQLIPLLRGLLQVSEEVVRGGILKLLATLVNNDQNTRTKIWTLLDSWIFDRPGFEHDQLSKCINSYALLSGLVDLLEALLSPLSVKSSILSNSEKFKHSFSLEKPRPIVHRYITFLMQIFPQVEFDTAMSRAEKLSLQLKLMSFMNRTMGTLNPHLLEMCQAAGVKDIEQVIPHVIQYLQAHPASEILRNLYDSRVYEAIIRIGNVGTVIFDFAEAPECIELSTVKESLKIVENVLERDSFYRKELVPVMRLRDNQFLDPANVGSGTGGLKNWNEVLGLNLGFVVNLGLYVGVIGTKLWKLCGGRVICVSEWGNVVRDEWISNWTNYKEEMLDYFFDLIKRGDEGIQLARWFFDLPDMNHPIKDQQPGKLFEQLIISMGDPNLGSKAISIIIAIWDGAVRDWLRENEVTAQLIELDGPLTWKNSVINLCSLELQYSELTENEMNKLRMITLKWLVGSSKKWNGKLGTELDWNYVVKHENLIPQLCDIYNLSHQSPKLNSTNISNIVVEYLNIEKYRESLWDYYNHWTLIVQMLAAQDRGYILEILQKMIPKIDEYFETDYIYAEPLIKLAVYLIRQYQPTEVDGRRLQPLWRMCIRGVLTPNVAPSIRANLYILLAEYLDISAAIIDLKLLQIVYQDVWVGNNESQTALLFLEKCVLRGVELDSAFVKRLVNERKGLAVLTRLSMVKSGANDLIGALEWKNGGIDELRVLIGINITMGWENALEVVKSWDLNEEGIKMLENLIY